MATRKKAEIKAVTRTITASSRASIKVGDSFYTVEYQEERVIPDGVAVDIEAERKALWDTVNTECDNQVADILTTYKK